MANNTPKVILADLNKDNEYGPGEIIALSTQAATNQQKKTDPKKQACNRLCEKKMKIRPEKERVHDKSYEL